MSTPDQLRRAADLLEQAKRATTPQEGRQLLFAARDLARRVADNLDRMLAPGLEDAAPPSS